MVSDTLNLISRVDFWSTCFIGIALRAIISLHSYSGKGKPPLYGDYEAQRHWQEITVNLPAEKWYSNSSENNLQYWGLDYPPLTAYHSHALGKIANILNSSYVELHKSQGIETSSHKSFMRLTVLAADIVLYIPAAAIYTSAVKKLYNKENCWEIFLLIVMYPGQILIDNGHFQYNNVSLGLAALAIAWIIKERYILACVFYTLALNYKQMELYHSMPFFVYILGICVRSKSITNLLKYAGAVITTCVILWSPWILSVESLKIVIGRIFPVARGVYEDKVANFWCAINVIIKLKRNFSQAQLGFMCAMATILTVMPIAFIQFRRLTKYNFLFSLFNCALCFYLFSYQVHEKSILLVALPALALYYESPFLIIWFLQLTTCSMITLFLKDGLMPASFIMYLIFYLTFSSSVTFKNGVPKHMVVLYKLSHFIIILLMFCMFFAPSPKNLPHIYSFAMLLFIFMHFSVFLLYFTCSKMSIKSLKK